ncbi:MAG: ribose 5-phosphate isomerase A [Clostridia bacterium]|nr:ribose 5-phosphate isomerase A [Clostridia bacterium]
MNWEENVKQKSLWNGEISNLEEKERIAKKLAQKVKDGDVIGVGSGSTAFLATKAIAERMKKENLHITAIPTSHEIKMLCENLGIPTTNLLAQKPDWAYDGADEVTSKNWLVKGRGGAMYKEKLNIAASPITYILVDNSKIVEHICDKFPIPIEVNPEAINLVRQALNEMGAESVTLRLAKGKDGPIVTESGNVILDTIFRNVDETYEKKLKSIVGVVETGLFIGYPVEIEK